MTVKFFLRNSRSSAYYKPSKFTFSEILPRQVGLLAHDVDGWLN